MNSVPSSAMITVMRDKSAKRRISAPPMPILRARLRCSGGSLFVRTEMKTRLSMPSTTSITTSVPSAIQAAGLVARASVASSMERSW